MKLWISTPVLRFWKQAFSLSLLHLLFIAVPGQNVQSKCLNLIWSLDKLSVRETYFRNMDGSVQKSLYILLYFGHVSHCLKRVLTRGKSSNWFLLMGPLGPLGSCVHMKDFKWFRTFEWLQKGHILIAVRHPPGRVIHPSVFIHTSLQAWCVLGLQWELWEEFSISKQYIHYIECTSLHFSLTPFLFTKFYLMVEYKTQILKM